MSVSQLPRSKGRGSFYVNPCSWSLVLGSWFWDIGREAAVAARDFRRSIHFRSLFFP